MTLTNLGTDVLATSLHEISGIFTFLLALPIIFWIGSSGRYVGVLVRSATAMYKRLVSDALDAGSLTANQLANYTDEGLLLGLEAKGGHPLLARLRERRLYKRAVEIPAADLPAAAGEWSRKLLAAGLVVLLTLVHASNRRNSGGLQVAFTILKVGVILGFCAAAIVLADQPQPVRFLPGRLLAASHLRCLAKCSLRVLESDTGKSSRGSSAEKNALIR